MNRFLVQQNTASQPLGLQKWLRLEGSCKQDIVCTNLYTFVGGHGLTPDSPGIVYPFSFLHRA